MPWFTQLLMDLKRCEVSLRNDWRSEGSSSGEHFNDLIVWVSLGREQLVQRFRVSDRALLLGNLREHGESCSTHHVGDKMLLMEMKLLPRGFQIIFILHKFAARLLTLCGNSSVANDFEIECNLNKNLKTQRAVIKLTAWNFQYFFLHSDYAANVSVDPRRSHI